MLTILEGLVVRFVFKLGEFYVSRLVAWALDASLSPSGRKIEKDHASVILNMS